MNARRVNLLPFILGLASVPLIYLPLLIDPENALLYRDLTNLQIPLKMEWVRAFLELGRIPHWNPLHASGFPFLADPNYGPLYPLNFLLLPFNQMMARGLLWFILLHHLLLYIGAYLLARDFRVRSTLAAAAGIAFSWSGYAVSCDNMVNMLCAQTAMPFFWWLLRRGARKNLFCPELPLAGLALAWPIYAGDPQFTYLGALTSPLLLLPLRGRSKRGMIFRLLVLGISVFLASLPQLLPIVGHLWESERFGSRDSGMLLWSLHPLRAIEAWFALAFGPNPDPRQYFGMPLVNGGHSQAPFIFSFYLGASLAAGLLLYLNLLLKKRSRIRVRTVLRISVIAILFFASLGVFAPLPVYETLSRFIPFWGHFRYPERIFFWPASFFLIAAVIGAERLIRIRKNHRGVPLLLSCSVFASGAGIIAFWLFSRNAPLGPIFLSLATFGIAFLLLTKGTTRLLRDQVGWFLFIIVLLDFARPGLELVWPQPVALTNAANLSLVRRLLADEGGRLGWEARRMLSLKKPHKIPLENIGKINVMTLETAESWGFLRYNTPGAFALETAQGHSPLLPEKATANLFGPDQQREWDLRSVRYLLDFNEHGADLRLNDSALPFAFIAQEIESVSPAEAEARYRDPHWNPHKTTLVEGTPAISAWKITEVKKQWDEISVELKAAREGPGGWLIVTEHFSPYWFAHLSNGDEIKLSRANDWALAVELPAVSSKKKLQLQLHYREPWFRLGLYGFGLWLALLAIFSRKPRRSANV